MKIVYIDTCHECPNYDNQYYTYNETCDCLDRKIEDGVIPDDCPLEDTITD